MSSTVKSPFMLTFAFAALAWVATRYIESIEAAPIIEYRTTWEKADNSNLRTMSIELENPSRNG